jgi:zinc D-Ala-D-Ala carboxypeptidase
VNIRHRIPYCPHGSILNISADLVKKLEELETRLQLQLHYNSGYRCPDCNREAAGVPDSAHMKGYAVDISCPGGSLRYKIIKTAITLDFRRIGVGKNFIHLDIDEELPQRVVWVY